MSAARVLIVIFITGFLSPVAAQKIVAITMDDAPMLTWPASTSLASIAKANDDLLHTLTDWHMPVTLFINEVNLDNPARVELLKRWIEHPLVIAGNHTFSHVNYTQVTTDVFKDEIVRGEQLTRALLKSTGKPLSYFRFPFNATGRDSTHRDEMKAFLASKGYSSTPFTVESADYLFNTLYQHALVAADTAAAGKVARAYIDHTVEVFRYAEHVCREQYGRLIPQVYLCHVNQLNADHLGTLAARLKKNGYHFADLPAVLKDPAYAQAEHYAGPYGFSWLYRWEKDVARRNALLREQPEPPNEIYQAYLRLLRKPSK